MVKSTTAEAPKRIDLRQPFAWPNNMPIALVDGVERTDEVEFRPETDAVNDQMAFVDLEKLANSHNAHSIKKNQKRPDLFLDRAFRFKSGSVLLFHRATL